MKTLSKYIISTYCTHSRALAAMIFELLLMGVRNFGGKRVAKNG